MHTHTSLDQRTSAPEDLSTAGQKNSSAKDHASSKDGRESLSLGAAFPRLNLTSAIVPEAPIRAADVGSKGKKIDDELAAEDAELVRRKEESEIAKEANKVAKAHEQD